MDKDVLAEWRESERPVTPEPVPTKDAMTIEQRQSALACASRDRLRDIRSQFEIRMTSRPSKTDLAITLAASDITIPDDTYELWKLNRGRMSMEAVRPAPMSRRDSIEPYRWETAERIKTNMESVKDKLYPAYIDKLRQKTDSLMHGIGTTDRPLDLHPPGFKAKRFPCLMFGGAKGRSINVTLPLGNDLEKTVSSRLARPIKVVVKVKVVLAQLILNNDKDQLNRLCSWGGQGETSHLCHSKFALFALGMYVYVGKDGPWCQNLGHIVVESPEDNRRRKSCTVEGECI